MEPRSTSDPPRKRAEFRGLEMAGIGGPRARKKRRGLPPWSARGGVVRPIKEAMRKQLGEARPGPNGNGSPVVAASTQVRLLPVSAKIELALSREIDDYAKAHGITRSRAAGQYLTIARETLRSRE